MNSLSDSRFDHPPIKILCIADQGDGKTCSTASLALLGYSLCLLDCDKGSETLQNLLHDQTHYPYASYLSNHNLLPSDLVSSISIDQEMELGEIKRELKDQSGRALQTPSTIGLKPANSKAFTKVSESLMAWNDGKNNFGSIYKWGPEKVLIIDTIATMARFAYYYNQGINNRLGFPEDVTLNSHLSDLNAAQVWSRKIMEVISSSAVKCNVIVFTHIDWVDRSRGFSQTPENRARQNPNQPIRLTGLPEIIGKAFGPKIGKYFNNLFCIRKNNEERQIWTTSTDGISCKRSGWLEDHYSQSTGMAQIFAELTNKPLPIGFLEAFGQKSQESKPSQNTNPKPVPNLPIQRPAPLH